MASDDTSSKGRFGLARLFRRENGQAPASASAEANAIVDSAEAFKSLRVGDIMTPRADIVAVELSTTFSELLSLFLEAEHSRMPVYRATLDDPVGVVHVKDVFKLLAGPERTPAPTDAPLKGLMRDVLYVPPSMPAAALLTRMRAARSHLAMVIDEFGGVDGLVTMEDLVEAVVGEIEDEHDETQGPRVLARAGGIVEADARAPLEDLFEVLGMAPFDGDEEEDIDTVGGLVMAIAGRVPERGEVIVHPAGLEFEVIEADPRRIRHVRVRDVRPAEGAAAG